MNKNQYELERQHQELVKRAHSLIAAIASRPGSLKLLRITVAMLQSYAAYKANRNRDLVGERKHGRSNRSV
jgi:hypothetical protein